MRRAAKVDSNQAAIVAALREIPGVSVDPFLARLGQGRPDIMVGYENMNYLFEIKMPKENLTNDEIDYFEEWKGQIDIAYTVDDILRVLWIK